MAAKNGAILAGMKGPVLRLRDGNFLVGPAVDQAAEYMNEPEGAFIWVLPGAAERHNTFRTRSLAIMNLPKKAIMAAHSIAALRGVSTAADLLNTRKRARMRSLMRYG